MKTKSIYQRIKDNINRYDEYGLFIAKDFYDYGSPGNVKVILSRLEKEGFISRVFDGIYHKKVYSHLLGKYASPDVETVVRKIASKYGWNITPSGEYSLNILHLSTQVPAKYTFISSGPYRKYVIANNTVCFKHAANKYIRNYTYLTSLVIEAFRTLGEKNIDRNVYAQLSTFLTKDEICRIKDEAVNTSTWIYKKLVELYHYA